VLVRLGFEFSTIFEDVLKATTSTLTQQHRIYIEPFRRHKTIIIQKQNRFKVTETSFVFSQTGYIFLEFKASNRYGKYILFILKCGNQIDFLAWESYYYYLSSSFPYYYCYC
jgi:hypothetical protein